MKARFLVGIACFVGLDCGSDYGEQTPPAGSSTSSSGSDSGATNPITGAKLEATPGKIECGKEICDVATQICCVASASDLKCQPKDKGCGGGGSASCDDAADCTDPAKPKCCGSAQGFNKSNTTCVAKCDGINSAQSCHSTTECGSQECIHQSCFGFTSWLCGLNPFCQKL